MLAVTVSAVMSAMVAKPELDVELELDAELEPDPEPPLPDPDDEPPPEDEPPTTPLRATTRPLMGDVRVALARFASAVARVFSALVTFDWAESTCDFAEVVLPPGEFWASAYAWLALESEALALVTPADAVFTACCSVAGLRVPSTCPAVTVAPSEVFTVAMVPETANDALTSLTGAIEPVAVIVLLTVPC